METDRENSKHAPAPAKSSSFANRDSDSSKDKNHYNNNNHDLDQKPNQNQDQDQDQKQMHHDPIDHQGLDHDTLNPPDGERPHTAEIEEELTVADNVGAPQPDGDPTELPTAEEDISAPPPPDLGKVSEEIDHFISSLPSSTKGGGDDDNAQQPADAQQSDEIPEFLEQFAVLVESLIAKYESTDGPMRWNQLSEDHSSSFLESVNRVSKLYTSLWKFSSESKYSFHINRIGGILERAMCFLEEEYRTLLEDYQILDLDNNNSNNVQEPKSKQLMSSLSTVQDKADHCVLPEPESNPNHDQKEFPGYSEETASNLSKLAKTLISLGHDTECFQDYFISRRNALESCLHKLGFEKFSIDDVQKMNWEALEREIATWMKTFQQFSTVLLSVERKLAEAVFSHDHNSIVEGLFSSLSRGVIVQLLNFAEAVAMTKRSSEKLFKLLDIYETLRDFIPAIADMFPVECLDELKTEASLIRGRLGETIISIFCELENSIKADTGKTPVPGGAVHPLTRYIMNYLTVACEYKDTLEQVFREHQKIDRADSSSGSDYDCNNAQASSNQRNDQVKQSPFMLQLGKVMDLLDANLETKSRLYKDPALSIIFLMNNGRYILQKIKGSAAIKSLMGDPWSRKRSSELRQYHTNYKRETWGKLLNCLCHEGLNVNGKVVKPVLKERFKSFNAMFDEIHRTQSAWVVSDEQLQSELRVSISAIVIPAYRSFTGRFSQVFTPGRQTEKYIKYQPEDIETHIDELFDGNTAVAQGRRRI